MNLLKRFLPAIGLFAGAFAAVAGTIHVSATGGDDDNGDGTQGKPSATISKAMTVAEAGSEIHVRGGLYVENLTDATLNDLTILGCYDDPTGGLTILVR